MVRSCSIWRLLSSDEVLGGAPRAAPPSWFIRMGHHGHRDQRTPKGRPHKGHVKVELLPLWLGPLSARILSIVTQVAALGVITLCLIYGFEFWHLAQSRGWTSDTVTAVPLWIPYLALPVGLGLLALQIFADLIETCLTPASEGP